ncbi:MAG: RnfH family protein [Pseudomonadota bacterium]
MTTESSAITVEVAFALPHKQRILSLSVAAGTTALEAARQSGIDQLFSDIDLEHAKFGIFGSAVAAGHVLRAGDRVEIYRPLIADPKEVRKARAAKAKARREAEKTAAKKNEGIKEVKKDAPNANGPEPSG